MVLQPAASASTPTWSTVCSKPSQTIFTLQVKWPCLILTAFFVTHDFGILVKTLVSRHLSVLGNPCFRTNQNVQTMLVWKYKWQKLSVISTHPTEHVVLLQSGRQRKKAVMMPRVVLTPLKVNGEHVPSGENHWEQCVEEQHKTKGQKGVSLSALWKEKTDSLCVFSQGSINCKLVSNFFLFLNVWSLFSYLRLTNNLFSLLLQISLLSTFSARCTKSLKVNLCW